jgi:hypothetical protein
LFDPIVEAAKLLATKLLNFLAMLGIEQHYLLLAGASGVAISFGHIVLFFLCQIALYKPLGPNGNHHQHQTDLFLSEWL